MENKIKIQTFEEYLEDLFIRTSNCTKDNVEDRLDNWLSGLEPKDLIDLAEGFGRIQYIQGARDYIQEQINKK